MGIILAIFFVLQVLIQTYFGLVLFTHWRNSNLPKNLGGTIPMAPREQRIQMESIPEITQT